MTTYAWPTGRAFLPGEAALITQHLQGMAESALSGYVQTVTRPGSRWRWRLDFNHATLDDRRAMEGFLLRLRGREHRVRLWDFKHPRPRGTCALSGVTLGASAAQFANALQLAGCGAGATLLAGDWLATPAQLLRVAADATANGAGAMTVEVEHMLRTATTSGTAITLSQPTALYVQAESTLELPRTPGLSAAPFSVEFVEVFA